MIIKNQKKYEKKFESLKISIMEFKKHKLRKSYKVMRTHNINFMKLHRNNKMMLLKLIIYLQVYSLKTHKLQVQIIKTKI